MKKKPSSKEKSDVIELTKSFKMKFDDAHSVGEKHKIIKEFETYCQGNEYLQTVIKTRYQNNAIYINDIFEIDYFSYSLSEILVSLEFQSN